MKCRAVSMVTYYGLVTLKSVGIIQLKSSI
jgi:hypothetical protein